MPNYQSKLICCVTGLLLGCISAEAFAGGGPSTPDTVGTLSVKGDGYALGPGEAYLYASSGSWSSGNPDACSSAYPYTYSMTTPAGQALHASILAALIAARQITVYIDGCLNGKPQVSRVDVR